MRASRNHFSTRWSAESPKSPSASMQVCGARRARSPPIVAGAPPVMPIFRLLDELDVLRRAVDANIGGKPVRLEHLAHELLAHPRQARRLATRVSGHALGPRAALAVRFFLRLIRHLTALRR